MGMGGVCLRVCLIHARAVPSSDLGRLCCINAALMQQMFKAFSASEQLHDGVCQRSIELR